MVVDRQPHKTSRIGYMLHVTAAIATADVRTSAHFCDIACHLVICTMMCFRFSTPSYMYRSIPKLIRKRHVFMLTTPKSESSSYIVARPS